MNSNIINILILSLCFFYPSNAQFFKKKSTKVNKEKISTNTQKGIKEKTKNCIVYDGLFRIYQNKEDAKSFLEIDVAHLNQDYIYFSYVENGVVDARNVRGRFRGSKIFKVDKFFNKINFTIENTSYYFDPNNPLSNASDANINKPIVISEAIIAYNSDSTKFLINADNIFLTESLQQVKSSYSSTYRGFKLGSLSKNKTHYSAIKNYPNNTDVIVEYVYENKYPTKKGSLALSDSRIVSIKIQHSLIKVPSNQYKPRYDDPRVGYFHTQTNDMTSVDQINYRDMIHRWDLQKKYPEELMSEPVKPIVWWIENTTPLEFRDIIKKGVESWNLAFEKAGFLNAIEVKIQPDTALWDAGDIRYNVLRWTSSPNPPWGGYGPSFVNPKTGQILGADIMLEWVYVTNRIKYDYLYLNEENKINHIENHDNCLAARETQLQNFLGSQYIDFYNLGSALKKDLVTQSLYRLVLHEVGHTLGLSHNFKGSTLLSNDEIKNKNIVSEKGLCSSVMEYPAINIASDPKNQGLFYDIKPGLYDCWAIQYGYSAFPDSIEKLELSKLLSKSNQKELSFANDADDMRSPGKGIDPNAMINDLTNDPVQHAIDRMNLINDMLPNLKNNYTSEGNSYERLKRSYLSLISSYFGCLDIISRQIGGIRVDRSYVNQNSLQKPFEPVLYDIQKNAMNVLREYAFEKSTLIMMNDLYPYLQSQRRGFNFRSSGEDPKILSLILRRQNLLLQQLLHQNVLARISNSSLYGNAYSLTEYMIDLRKAIFEQDMYGNVSDIRKNLQISYLEKLLSIVSESSIYSKLSKSSAYYNVNWIFENLDVNTGDLSSRQHKEYLLYMIEAFKKK